MANVAVLRSGYVCMESSINNGYQIKHLNCLRIMA